jgi:hypothetical protein
MRHPSRIHLACVALGLPFVTSSAQIVRGTVREHATDAPVAGVLITVEPATEAGGTSAAATSVLTDGRGIYAAIAPGPGRYHIIAKRIGTRRFTSDAFDLAAGETKQLDIGLDPVLHSLPEVSVAATNLCVSRGNQTSQVVALWDEARTALMATGISRRSVSMQLTRYTRVLDPRTLRVVSEGRAQHDIGIGRSFTSMSGDSLSKIGFWRALPGDTIEFYAPDADVLMSRAFLHDHCFLVVTGRRDHTGQVGLAFEPAIERSLPDIRGTMWLNALTFELQAVEFRYTQMPRVEFADRNGGEVVFARMPNGAWIVRRWYTRMPLLRQNTVPVGSREQISMNVLVLSRIIEEGGEITAAGVATPEPRASLTGVALDSLGSPLAGALVELAGTGFRTHAGAHGEFTLDSVPRGRYRVMLQSSSYTPFGIPAAEQELLVEGDAKELSLRASGMRELATRLCVGHDHWPGLATLRVALVDSSTSMPLAGVTLRLQWNEYGERVWGLRRVVSRAITATTDAAGAAVFCELPRGLRLELGFPLDEEQISPLSTYRLRADEVMVYTVRTRKR